MHKYFEGLTLTGGALLVLSFLFAVFFRFYSLESQSPWIDELATWYYSRHLDEVFFLETHSPLYYFIVRLLLGNSASVESIRYLSATVSCLNLIVLFLIGLRFMDRQKLTLFLILLALSPSDIIQSRMARHYGLLLEGTLLFLFLIKANARTWLLSLVAILMGFLHVFFLIPMSFILLFEYLQNRNHKKVLTIFLSSLAIIIYYLVRRLFPDFSTVTGNLTWSKAEFVPYLRASVLQFSGHTFPHSKFFPLSIIPASFLVISGLAYFLYRKSRMGLLFVVVWIGGILFVELLNIYWMNLRISRLMIYLPGLFIFSLADAVPKPNEKHFVAAFVLSFFLLFPLNVFTSFDGDNEFIEEWKTYTMHAKETPKLICANKFQVAYYNIEAPLSCNMAYSQIDLRKPLIFMDLDGNNRTVAKLLSLKMLPVDYKNSNGSLIIHFEPR